MSGSAVLFLWYMTNGLGAGTVSPAGQLGMMALVLFMFSILFVTVAIAKKRLDQPLNKHGQIVVATQVGTQAAAWMVGSVDVLLVLFRHWAVGGNTMNEPVFWPLTFVHLVILCGLVVTDYAATPTANGWASVGVTKYAWIPITTAAYLMPSYVLTSAMTVWIWEARTWRIIGMLTNLIACSIALLVASRKHTLKSTVIHMAVPALVAADLGTYLAMAEVYSGP